MQPDFARAYCNRGLTLVRKGAYEEALKDLEAGVQKDPNLALCHFARGDVQIAMGKPENAIDDFTKGLQLAPNVEGLIKRAELYERLSDKAKARADFNAALQLAPNFTPAQEGIKRLGAQGN